MAKRRSKSPAEIYAQRDRLYGQIEANATDTFESKKRKRLVSDIAGRYLDNMLNNSKAGAKRNNEIGALGDRLKKKEISPSEYNKGWNDTHNKYLNTQISQRAYMGLSNG